MKPRTLKPLVDLDTHDQPFVTVHQVCGFLQVEKRQVLKWIDCGLLAALRLPGGKGEWRIALSTLRGFVDQQHLRPVSRA